MTTTPLRPDLAHRATLGRWLRIQAEAITRPWINVVLARRVYRPEQISSRPLRKRPCASCTMG